MPSSDRMDEENANTAGPRSPLIMAEIQALTIRAHSTFYSLPKPVDDSSAPLVNDTERQQEVGVPGQQPAKYERIRDIPLIVWVKLFAILAPIVIASTSWAVLTVLGVDPLAFGMLAFFLTLALVTFIVMVCLMFL
jgi:hypothetical protein